MARRQLAERTNTEVAMPNEVSSAAALIPAAQQIGNNVLGLVQARDRMNMNNMLSDANMEMAKVTSEWQIENASNPFAPEAAEKLKLAYSDIFSKYGEKVSVTSRGDWAEAQGKLTSQYVQSNMRWGMGQAVKNAESSVNMSFEKGNQFAYESGVAGVDVGLVNGNYATRAEMVKKSLSTIGKSDQQIEEILMNHKSDYTKNYVTGAIFRNPERGQELLKDKKVIDDIGSPEAVQALNSYVEKRRQEIKIQNIRANDAKAGENLMAILDENTSYAEKLAKIDLLQLDDTYSEGKAAVMRRLVKSKEAINAVTDNASRADILQRTSDAYVAYQADGDEEAYFEKMAEIRTAVSSLAADGKYNSKEVMKLNNQIEQMTRKSNSDAAQELQYETTYGDAIAYFKETVPASLRDTAIREYFQKSDQAVMPQEKALSLMTEIADRLSAKNRNKALEVSTKTFAETKKNTAIFRDANGNEALVEVDENGKFVKVIEEY